MLQHLLTIQNIDYRNFCISSWELALDFFLFCHHSFSTEMPIVRDEVLKNLEMRARAFNCLAALVHMALTWWLKFNLLSSITPSTFTWGSGFNTILSSICSVALLASTPLWDMIINWNLDGFACIPLSRNHFTAFLLFLLLTHICVGELDHC